MKSICKSEADVVQIPQIMSVGKVVVVYRGSGRVVTRFADSTPHR